MGNSLRDELLKAGLVSETKAEKPRRRKQGNSRAARNNGDATKQASVADGRHARDTASSSTPEGGAPARARHVLRENQRRTARFVRDPTLGGESLAESARKAQRRKIQALIESERLNQAQAEIPYHFIKGKRVKRIYVTAEQRAELGSGAIVIAALDADHHLLRVEAADALLALAPQTVVCRSAEVSADSEEHPVPDDITW